MARLLNANATLGDVFSASASVACAMFFLLHDKNFYAVDSTRRSEESGSGREGNGGECGGAPSTPSRYLSGVISHKACSL